MSHDRSFLKWCVNEIVLVMFIRVLFAICKTGFTVFHINNEVPHWRYYVYLVLLYIFCIYFNVCYIKSYFTGVDNLQPFNYLHSTLY